MLDGHTTDRNDRMILLAALQQFNFLFFFLFFALVMETLKALVARVARAFYDPKYIAILDALNNAPPNTNGVREEDLVFTLKMTPRDIHRICGKLKEDRLIKM